MVTVTEHYFSRTPSTPDRPRSLTVDLAGRSVEVTTSSGVFSPTRLDIGTQALLGELPAPTGGNLLDLGCGWGPLSLHAALEARDAGTDLTVWALDVNERALDLTRANAESLGLTGIRPVFAEDVPADLGFDMIWSNPPIRVGKDVLHGLLETWLPRLNPGGSAWLVVAKKLGADSLLTWMRDMLGEGWDVRREANSKGFRILVVERLG